MEDMVADVSTFSGKGIELEYAVSKANGLGGRIDVKVDIPGKQPLLIEYKWYGGDETVAKDLFLDEFVNRDLNTVSSLNELQWRIKGNKLTKTKVLDYLKSAEGREVLDNQKIMDLIEAYRKTVGYSKSIVTPDRLIEFLEVNNNWFNLIFK